MLLHYILDSPNFWAYVHLPVSVEMPFNMASHPTRQQRGWQSEQPNCFSASLWSESKQRSWLDLQQRGSGLESDSLSPSKAVCLAPDRSACSQSWTGNRTKLDQRGIREGEVIVSQLDIIGEWDLEITCNRIIVMQGNQTAPRIHAGLLFTSGQKNPNKSLHWMHV